MNLKDRKTIRAALIELIDFTADYTCWRTTKGIRWKQHNKGTYVTSGTVLNRFLKQNMEKGGDNGSGI